VDGTNGRPGEGHDDGVAALFEERGTWQGKARRKVRLKRLPCMRFEAKTLTAAWGAQTEVTCEQLLDDLFLLV